MGGLLAAGQPDQAAGCAWNLGWAGWAELCLGGLLDGQGLCHTHLGLSGWRVGWAGPEASRRHVRHASRRAEGLGLRRVSRRGWALDDLGPDASRRSRVAWAAGLGG